MARKYLVKERGGKWHYRLRGEATFHTTGLDVRYNRDGQPTERSRDEALRFASDEWERRGNQSTTVQPIRLGAFLDPYYDYDRCPHIARVLNDKGRYSQETARAQRRRIEMYVLDDPIAARYLPVVGAPASGNLLTAGDLEDWKSRMRRKTRTVGPRDEPRQVPVGARTVNSTLSDLKAALQEGVHRNTLIYNPAATVGRIKTTEEPHGYFTVDEVRRILAGPESWPYARNHGNASGKLSPTFWYTFALSCYALGTWPKAIRALKWRHYNDDTITFPAEVVKTNKARTVPIAAQLSAALEELRDQALRIAADDYVFCFDNGVPIGRTAFAKPFARMMEHLTLPATDFDGHERKPYSLKHSLITHLIDEGVDEVLVRDYVGHSHSYGTSRVLTPVQGRYKRRQIDKLRGEVVPVIEGLLG